MPIRVRRILAGGLACLSAILTYSFLASLRPNQTVLVVTQEVEPRTPLTSEMVTFARVDPASLKVLAADAFTSEREIADLVAVRRLQPGEVLRQSAGQVARVENIAQVIRDGRVPRSSLVPSGQRAVTIPLDDDTAVRQGETVDLFHTPSDSNGTRAKSTLLVSEVIVLDDEGTDESGRRRAITILVKSGDDVRRVLEARRNGTVDVVVAPPAKRGVS